MRFASLALILLLVSGYAMAQQFTCSIQWAGYPFDKFDEKGSINYEQFVERFESFPWATQVGKADGGSEPTIYVRDHKTNTILWVSAAKNDNSYVYLIGVVYTKEMRGFLGIGKPKPVRWVEIYIAQDTTTVQKDFKVFFSERDDELFDLLHKLPKFEEMKSKM